MKQGSTDDPFAEEPESGPDGDEQPPASEEQNSQDATEDPVSRQSTDHSQTQKQSLPYIHARDGVKDGRTQRPVFFRDHVEEGIDDLVDEMEDEFGETVYKTDITEAAMVIAEKNPELLLAKLEEWGYGWS
jgi:hypothetical protein